MAIITSQRWLGHKDDDFSGCTWPQTTYLKVKNDTLMWKEKFSNMTSVMSQPSFYYWSNVWDQNDYNYTDLITQHVTTRTNLWETFKWLNSSSISRITIVSTPDKALDGQESGESFAVIGHM